jgi:hypothetical protein
MKKSLLIIVVLLFGINGFGQENQITKGGNYYFKNVSSDISKNLDSKAKSYDSLKEEISNVLQGTSYIVKVNKIENDTVFFVFGLFDEDDREYIINHHQLDTIQSLNNNNNNNNNSQTISNKRKYLKNIQYSLPKNIFSDNVSVLYNRLEYRVGVYTIPFKLRLSSFSFDANVNLGANLGAKIRWNRRIENGFALEPIFGFGLASIKLDKDNSIASEPTNVSAFTINTGILFHLTDSINVGLTYGFDNISQNDQNNYKWKYQGKGWLGIGMNISFSNQNKNTGSTQSN